MKYKILKNDNNENQLENQVADQVAYSMRLGSYIVSSTWQLVGN